MKTLRALTHALLVVAFTLISTTFAVAPAAAGEPASVSKLALITIDGSIDIDAPMERVWQALTETDLAHSWYPGWKSTDPSASLNKVGTAIRFNDGYGNSGLSVVLFVDPGTELRVAHVPDNGSYVCQVKFRLVQRPGKTVVNVTEQYSDALDVPTDKDTALMTRREIESYLVALKSVAEGGPAPGEGAAASALLDGKVFVGEIGEDKKLAFASETLSFVGGGFRSAHSDQYQFGQTPYTAREKGDAIVFEANTLSPTEGRMKWKGTVEGTHIDATVDWYDKSGNLIKKYWVKGTLKSK